MNRAKESPYFDSMRDIHICTRQITPLNNVDTRKGGFKNSFVNLILFIPSCQNWTNMPVSDLYNTWRDLWPAWCYFLVGESKIFAEILGTLNCWTRVHYQVLGLLMWPSWLTLVDWKCTVCRHWFHKLCGSLSGVSSTFASRYSSHARYQSIKFQICGHRNLRWALLMAVVVIMSSFNQSNFYSANIPGKASFIGATAESVFNSKIEETVWWHQRAIKCASVYVGKAKSVICILTCFLELATEMAEQTNSSRLF